MGILSKYCLFSLFIQNCRHYCSYLKHLVWAIFPFSIHRVHVLLGSLDVEKTRLDTSITSGGWNLVQEPHSQHWVVNKVSHWINNCLFHKAWRQNSSFDLMRKIDLGIKQSSLVKSMKYFWHAPQMRFGWHIKVFAVGINWPMLLECCLWHLCFSPALCYMISLSNLCCSKQFLLELANIE